MLKRILSEKKLSPPCVSTSDRIKIVRPIVDSTEGIDTTGILRIWSNSIRAMTAKIVSAIFMTQFPIKMTGIKSASVTNVVNILCFIISSSNAQKSLHHQTVDLCLDKQQTHRLMLLHQIQAMTVK